MLYPFLFNVYKDMGIEGGMMKDHREEYEYTLVKIAQFDMQYYDHSWWDDAEYENKVVCQPDVDLTKEAHKFSSEKEALLFIQQWWAKQNLKETQ